MQNYTDYGRYIGMEVNLWTALILKIHFPNEDKATFHKGLMDKLLNF